MNIIHISLLGISLIVSLWMLYRVFYVKRKTRKHAEEKLKSFEGLIHKLTANKSIDDDDVMHLAANPSTRHALYGILEEFGKADHFPPHYFSLEKSAESFLVNWLEFPTELNAPPDKIELFTKISLQENGQFFEYFVFRYKMLSPPAVFSDAWMLGVAGPFGPDSKPFDIPKRLFSRFNEQGAVDVTEEVRWVHLHINRK